MFYLIDIHQLGVADDFKSLLFDAIDFSNGFSHQEQLSPSANFCLHYFGLSNKILIE